MEQSETKTITMRIDKQLHKDAKIYAVQKDMSFQELVSELIRKEIYNNK